MFQPVLEEQVTIFQVEKARRGCEHQHRVSPGPMGSASSSALVLTRDLPLVSSRLQLLFKHGDLKIRNSFWKHHCLLCGVVNCPCEIKAAILNLGCMPESPGLFSVLFSFRFPGLTLCVF